MKWIHHIGAWSLAAIALLATSCKETGPQIDLTNGKHNVLIDTTYIESPVQTAEPKNVLVELFTGVACINCPAAHVTLDNIKAANPGRVIGVAIHGTNQASQDEPQVGSRQVLNNQDAQAIIDFFGEPGVRPVGGVDRVIHTALVPQGSIYDFASSFNSDASAQLAQATPVNMTLTNTYDASSRSGAVVVELHYTAAQSDSNKLTLYLTEDSIVTSQLQADNSNDTSYVHNDILRGSLTNILGDRINTNLVAGTVIKKAFSYTISDPLWRPEHMNIVAFVHRYTGSFEVLQTKIIKIQ